MPQELLEPLPTEFRSLSHKSTELLVRDSPWVHSPTSTGRLPRQGLVKFVLGFDRQHRFAAGPFLADQGCLYKNKDFGTATRAPERIERDRAGTKLQLENDEV